MAYGNFWGDVARGIPQGFEMGQRAQRARNEQEEFEHRKAEWKRLDDQRLALAAAGSTLDDPANTTGLLSATQYGELGAPPKKAKALPEPASGGPTQGLATAPAPQLKPDDYSAVMVGNQVMYAPKARVKSLDGADLVRARAQALGAFDPVVGSQLMVAANSLEKGNLEVASAKWGESVMQARRVAQVDAVRGLEMLTQGYKQYMPDLGDMKFAMGKDGGIEVTHFVNTKNGPVELDKQSIPAVNKDTGLTALDTIFTAAQSLSSPDAYRQHLIDTSQFAANTAELVAKRQSTEQQAKLFPLQQQALREGIATSQFNRTNTAANTYYDTGIDLTGSFDDNIPTIMQAEGTAQTNGWDTVLGDQPDGTNALGVKPPKPLTQMTVAEVYKWQREKLLPASGELNSTAAGGLQLTSENVKRFGKAFWNQKFTPEVQTAIARQVHAEQGYGAWEGLKRNAGLPQSPRARDVMLSRGGTIKDNQAQYKTLMETRKLYIDSGMDPAAALNAALSEMPTAFQQQYAEDQGIETVSLGGKERRAPPPARGLNKAGSSVTVDLPSSPQPKKPAANNSPAAKKAQAVMRLGGIAGQRERQRFEAVHGMTPEEALRNPAPASPRGRSVTTALPQPVTRGQLIIDANAAIMQGSKARAEFQRKYGQTPEAILRGRR